MPSTSPRVSRSAAPTASRDAATRTPRASRPSCKECAVQMRRSLVTDVPADASYGLPDARGHFGPYGGVFVAETLVRALDELKDAYARYQHDPEFVAEFERELAHYVGRPSPVYHAQ